MNGVAKNMDSVFDNASSNDIEFDVMFDQEDSLIDTVNGVNEAGDPLTGVDFEDLHQTQDDATAKDVAEGEGKDNPMGAPNPEGTKPAEQLDVSVKGEVDKESDADKFTKDADDNYQDGKDAGPKVDDSEVTPNVDKAVQESDIDDIMMDDEEDDEIETEKCNKEAAESEEDPDFKVKINEKSDEKEKDDEEEVTDEATNINVEDLENEISKESDIVKKDDTVERDGTVDEAADVAAANVDADVAAVDSQDLTDDEALIDATMGEEEDDNAPEKYPYEPSDEELLDELLD